ncbi:hypothetical protein [Actinosynnema pretiosum]|uniref:Lipoprotein n=1 Tax=Actinosynnema pretiosum TaxID=42197 RepID=A0A290ZCX9_9PSEU|nr:hypothetical protein [Actinosynnema pretiosum]ATE56891.1 hypothetical protein CNX65_29360 [Actinosynnema pretiosum]
MRHSRLIPAAAAALALVVTGCSAGAPSTTAAPSTPASADLPKGDLAQLAEKVDARVAALGRARFSTEGFASDGAGTEVRSQVTGSARWLNGVVTSAMTMDVRTNGATPTVTRLVSGVDGVYVSVDGAPMPAGKTWGFYTKQNSAEVDALLRGFGPSAVVGAELDYLEPRAAMIVGKRQTAEGTRYDLVVDPMKMAKAVTDPDIQLQHTQLAEYGVVIRAEVVVDETGAPSQAGFRFELGGKDVRSSTTRFADWGADVDVSTPPADQVVPADQLPQ